MESILSLVLAASLSITVLGQEFEDEDPAMNTPPPKGAVPATVPAIHELPIQIRKEIGEVKLSMIAWNSAPEERFVKVNDMRVGEGGVAGQELWVREIRPREVVFQYASHYFVLSR